MTSLQTTVSSEKTIFQIIKKSVLEQNKKQTITDKVVVNEPQLIGYILEIIFLETICRIGTQSVNGICKITICDETKFCFLFWCWYIKIYN